MLRPGDVVEVRTPDEILAMLDLDGTTARLPFMPEMIECCGRQFRVAKRVLKTCVSGPNLSTMRRFPDNDVLVLDAPRCSGADHDGCQKACVFFWREAWLRRADRGNADASIDEASKERLRARLKTRSGPDTYFCQASEILNATIILSRWARFGMCLEEVRAGNCTAHEMVLRIATWLFWRGRRLLRGEYARGNQKVTPVSSLRLAAGELVEVKPIDGIAATVDERGRNRGLYFSPDMGLLCGGRQRVERKLEKIIADGTGKIRQMENTVYLEDALCGCSHVAFGGCARCEFSYWREIWLKRLPDSSGAVQGPATTATDE